MRVLSIGLLLLASLASSAQAQQKSTDDIVNALKPKPLTRSLGGPQQPKGLATRAIQILQVGTPTAAPPPPESPPPALAAQPLPPLPPPVQGAVPPVAQPVPVAPSPPPVVALKPETVPEFIEVKKTLQTIDLTINFEYNSDIPTPQGQEQLHRLGVALRQLNGKFTLVGHTDALGSVEYNNALSIRRSAMVASYLVRFYGIPASNLSATGLGKLQLLPGLNPADERNRRVEIVALQ